MRDPDPASSTRTLRLVRRAYLSLVKRIDRSLTARLLAQSGRKVHSGRASRAGPRTSPRSNRQGTRGLRRSAIVRLHVVVRLGLKNVTQIRQAFPMYCCDSIHAPQCTSEDMMICGIGQVFSKPCCSRFIHGSVVQPSQGPGGLSNRSNSEQTPRLPVNSRET